MRWARTLGLRFRSLFQSGRVERELGDELQYHLDRLIDDFVQSGMSLRDARYAALREMGALEPRKEDCRDARGLHFVDTIRQDVSYALRALRRTPVFTGIAAILSLALGIGATAAIFSLRNGVLHDSLPGVSEPGQLVMLSNPDDTGSWTGRWDGRTDGPRSWLTYGEFEELRDHADTFSSLMATQSSLITWQARFDGGGPEADGS
jgi:macrolide transport system ATP-binding/permease protein